MADMKPGDVEVMGLCWVRGCGGQITKTFCFNGVYDWSCTKGGDLHLGAEPAVKAAPTTTDAPAVQTACVVCTEPIAAGQEWTVLRVGRPVHVACGDPVVVTSYPRATKPP